MYQVLREHGSSANFKRSVFFFFFFFFFFLTFHFAAESSLPEPLSYIASLDSSGQLFVLFGYSAIPVNYMKFLIYIVMGCQRCELLDTKGYLLGYALASALNGHRFMIKLIINFSFF